MLRVFCTSVIFPLLLACGDTTNNEYYSQAESSEEAIPTGAFVIEGSLQNGEDPDNNEILANQKISVIRNDGVLVAEGESNEDGEFALELPPGALIIDTSFNPDGLGLQAGLAAPTTRDFSYTLEAKIPNDGSGRALGIRRRIDIADSSLSGEGVLDTGANELREVTAIVGTIAFADQHISLAGVDIFIPGKPFFVRTGDDGQFSLLFVPAGTFSIRITKGIYIKDVDVTVIAGKTLALDTITVASNERNPLPLGDTLIGQWSTTCYYSDMADSVSPDDPVTGSISIESFDNLSLTGDSCVLRSRGAGDSITNFEELRVLGDGAIITKFGTDGFYFNIVTGFTQNEIVIQVDNSSLGNSPMIEVWTRLEAN